DRGDRGDRAAVGVARMDAPAVLAGRVNELLPALAEEALDLLHLGVRRPENPEPVLTHDFLRAPVPRESAGAHSRVRAWDRAFPARSRGSGRGLLVLLGEVWLLPLRAEVQGLV